jgi:hypothetical protein
VEAPAAAPTVAPEPVEATAPSLPPDPFQERVPEPARAPEPESYSFADTSDQYVEEVDPAPVMAEASSSEFQPPEDVYDPFAAEPPFRPRHSRARLWIIIALVVLLLAGAAAAAVFWFQIPGLQGLSLGQKGTPLHLQVMKPERQTMESGNSILTVTGMISNPTNKPQPVPPLHAQLRDPQGRVVYEWEISSPVPELAPKQTVTFNSAEVDFPPSARELKVQFVGE